MSNTTTLPGAFTGFTDDFAPFESPKLLIECTKERLVDFEMGCVAFLETCAYTPIEKNDNQTGEKVIKLRFDQRIPGRLRKLASDIVNDLRHALDQAVCDAAVLLGRKDRANLYFPFGKDVADLKNQIDSKCKRVNPDLIAFIRAFDPHYGGDDLLWALSRIAAPNKHQRILGIALDTEGYMMQGVTGTGPLEIGIMKWSDFRNELEIARVGRGGYLQMHLTLPLQIIIGTADIVGGKPALAVFNRFLSKAESIVLAIEAEALRLKGT